jgi:hypothetical protein
MEMLCYENLTLEQKMYLGGLEKHPGFSVFKMLMEDICMKATAKAISTDPEDPAYDTKLKSRQLTARITNDVCATLIKSIVMHSKAGEIETEAKKLQEVLEEIVGVEDPDVQFGSMRQKKSPSSKQKTEVV